MLLHTVRGSAGRLQILPIRGIMAHFSSERKNQSSQQQRTDAAGRPRLPPTSPRRHCGFEPQITGRDCQKGHKRPWQPGSVREIDDLLIVFCSSNGVGSSDRLSSAAILWSGTSLAGCCHSLSRNVK